MNMLVMGLYVEGPTDDRFLPVIIQRAAEHILLQYDRAEVAVLEPIVIKKHPDISERDKSILRAARDAYGFHTLIVHLDISNRQGRKSSGWLSCLEKQKTVR